ncbi:MAG: HAMP domain-containing histidine kinase [Methylococcales symbiont of Hymedesmia sp. n. MRB-2018]|nr:MAG: HAMP domain-containing histidine kinase [Methylococcales symbiont of Hymedesmia sp. n. MRB-2018]
MTSIEIIDKNEDVIFSNISPEHRETFKKNKNSKKDGIRSLFKKNKNDVGLWLVTDDKDNYNSTKIINKTFNFFSELFIGIHKHYEIITLSNTHTIATIQAKMSQQIEPLVGNRQSQRGNYQEATNSVKNKIEEDALLASKIICDLNKRIEEIDTHLKSLQVLENKTAVVLTSHPLKTMLLNIYSPFQDGFKDKEIKVNFDRIDGDLKIMVDYKIFSLVMHHFFDNGVKYSKPNDEVHFVYSNNNNCLVIDMHSLKIKKEDNIFEMGVSGGNTDTLAGNGIGMYVIKKGLNIMNMDIEITDKGVLDKNPKFSKNCFIVKCHI